MVKYSNGRFMCSVLCTRLTIQKQTGPVKKKTRWHQFVWHSSGWAVRYSDPHCAYFRCASFVNEETGTYSQSN